MKLIASRPATLSLLDRCRRNEVALFSPNGELPAEIEGLLLGGQRFAEEFGIKQLPIAIGMTGNYPDNPQFRKISTGCVTGPDLSGFHGGDVREGCEIWLRTLEVYQDLRGSFPDVCLLPFIDHGWITDDGDLKMLHDDSVVDRMAIIMHDASKLSVDENIKLTAEYVKRYGQRVVVEGAADKIYDPNDVLRLGLTREDQLSKPEDVIRFVKETGIDLVVPNLGTEHRSVGAGTADRRYEREIAQAIRDQLGPIMALHGSSCLGGKVGQTAVDGICKVNFYTAMAVGAGQRIYKILRDHETDVLEKNNLWINSESFTHDVRRRHVADVCYEMLGTLGYGRLKGTWQDVA
ncbi:MAG: class II fructose-bisphosphate aldolase [Planctomycetia bacterium]|nr:class II fructose-bisphosphate aldolase [Planctomycetia bacterium]